MSMNVIELRCDPALAVRLGSSDFPSRVLSHEQLRMLSNSAAFIVTKAGDTYLLWRLDPDARRAA